ncbi:MAG TPA: amidohydrolase family protein [Acidimicrobiales bacterium]|nr:amidohydrolase family protein [Acidimicrobiales bacterium]
MSEGSPYVLISTDGHCGAGLLEYKPYLESRHHDAFDRWAATYHDGWGDLDATRDPDDRIGIASFAAPLNWDSAKRIAYTEVQGIAAEVLFPNTAPPFSPSGSITSRGPASREEFELRFAGLRAHNRWLADFCADLPGRRAGLAQIFLDDIDLAIDEVTWAKEAGLMGVLLPSDHLRSMVDLYFPAYDPLWAACADLDLPVHRHGVFPVEIGPEFGDAAPWIGQFEVPFYLTRAIAHLICAGVFERYPALRFVTTEIHNGADLVAYLAKLDYMYESARIGGLPGSITPIQAAVDKLSRPPSSYFESNCSIGGPFDLRKAHQAGVPNLMYGADIPHSEGTAPHNREALRVMFAGLAEHEVRTLTSLTAARVYGFDLAALQTVADRIGPTVEEVGRPLPVAAWPAYPADTRSPVFAG